LQFDQSDHRESWTAEFHVRASGSVKHPGRYDGDHAWRELDMNGLATGLLFAVLPSKTAAIQRVPAVEDLNFLPDMGRMNR
jgi:hypothetical protein